MQEQINRPIAIEDYEGLCFKCLQKKDIQKYSLYRSEYGSSFDNNYTYLQVCKDCEPEKIGDWFGEEPEMIEDYCVDYKYEKNILDFINTLPIKGRELFWARCSYSACSDDMEGQDWIDYELGILPHERCKEYGYYSPQEIKAHNERFPICNKVKLVVYKDGSIGERCPLGASSSMSEECYLCPAFNERIGEIDMIDNYEMEILELEAKILRKKIEREINRGINYVD